MNSNCHRVTPSQALATRNWNFVGDKMLEAGQDILPFSITPPNLQTKAAKKAQSEDQAHADIFDPSSDNTQGSLTTTEPNSVRNKKGFLPSKWSNARE